MLPGEQRSYTAFCMQKKGMSTSETSVRVSRDTLSELDRFRTSIRAKTLDDAIHSLLTLKRRELIAQIYGSARASRAFRESDRLDVDH